MSDDTISREAAIARLDAVAQAAAEANLPDHRDGLRDAIAAIRALPAVEVGVKPECGHPFCGDKCGTATPAQDCREHYGDTDCSVTAYAAIARMKEAGE